MPYLIIICLAIILVLIFNLWRAISTPDFKEDAYMHVVDGSVQMKAWGTDSFFDLSADALIMGGDELRTSASATVIVEFADGTIMRLDGSTHVVFDNIEDNGSGKDIVVDLLEGSLWFNQVYKSTEDTNVQINLDNVVVKSDESSVYAVSNTTDEEMATVFGVFDDEGLLVEIMNQDGDKVIEQENLGIGQEIVFNAKVLDKYWSYQSPTVISALSDDFKNIDWYKWNISEDLSPSDFQKYLSSDNVGLQQVKPEVLEPEEGLIPVEEQVLNAQEEDSVTESDVESESENTILEEEKEPVVDLGPLGNPAITSVSGGNQVDSDGFYNVTGNPATIVGSITGASKVIVNNFTLTKFKPGDSSWTYYANADYDLMKVGENTYEVYAVDADGNKSEVVTFKVRYTPPSPEILVEKVVEEVESQESAEE